MRIQETLTEAQKKQFDALEQGETRRDRIWKDCTTKAKEALKKYDDARYEISDLAIKACDKSETAGLRYKYTVAAFAYAIGMDDHTLQRWVRARIAMLMVPPDKRNHPFEFFNDLYTAIDDKDSMEKVLAKYEKLAKYVNSQKSHYDRFIKILTNIENKAKDASFFKKADNETLSEISHHCNEIISYVDLYLKGRK